MYRLLLRPLLFMLPSEKAHEVTMGILIWMVRIPFLKKIVRSIFRVSDPSLECNLLGLRFPNPVGIAAGFDKNGSYIDALTTLGFGSIEVGTVTPRPQSGNPKPRLFRLKRSHALINRMGFNNDGCKAVADRLQRYAKRDFVLGANIGKNKDTPNEQAVDDYVSCFKELHPYVDYFVINVSSPNTPGLRALQEREPLKHLLQSLQQLNAALPQRKPLLLKIAPDLEDAQLDDIALLIKEIDLDGLVISNTTLSRAGLKEDASTVTAMGSGGLSGAPLCQRAYDVLKYLRARTPEHIVFIGVGGIDSIEKAQARLDAGASLIQLYTGLIYEGPFLIRKILRALAGRTPNRNIPTGTR